MGGRKVSRRVIHVISDTAWDCRFAPDSDQTAAQRQIDWRVIFSLVLQRTGVQGLHFRRTLAGGGRPGPVISAVFAQDAADK
jgi:hypothetical protein